MKVSVPKEVAEGERRVALVPEVAKRLSPTGVELVVESGAGEAAHHPDGAYEEAGVSVSGNGFDIDSGGRDGLGCHRWGRRGHPRGCGPDGPLAPTRRIAVAAPSRSDNLHLSAFEMVCQ